MTKANDNVTINYDFQTLIENVSVLDGFGLYDDMTAWALDDNSVNKGLNPDKRCDYTTLRRINDKGVFDSRNLVSIRFNKSSVQLMFNAKHSDVATLYENVENVVVNARKKRDVVVLYTITSADYKIIESVLCDCCRYENNESLVGLVTTAKKRTRKNKKAE